MSKYRQQLPQLDGSIFITDGGMETTLVFHQGIDLPYFASLSLVRSEEGREALRQYYRTYADLAQSRQVDSIVEATTWRGSPDWGRKLGYSPDELESANRQAVALCREFQEELEASGRRAIISAAIGPRGDGYRVLQRMNAEEAEQYHRTQIGILRDTETDMLAALTLPYPEEATGITRAAQDAGMPVVISFTLETDGRLPCGMPLEEAISQVDEATKSGPAYYMVNCVHPVHFENALEARGAWRERIRGFRANASTKSHAELDESTELDEGNPEELGGQFRKIKDALPSLNVMGGCCGTDQRHVEAIHRACTP